MNTALQRWVSADPLEVHGGGADPNLYAYVSGTVLQNVDPLGLEQEAPGAGSSLSPGNGETVRNPSLMDYGKKPAQVVSEPPARTQPKPAGGQGEEPADKVVAPPKPAADPGKQQPENSLMQEALVAGAFVSGETPDAIKTDGTGDPLGVPGGQCENDCVRSIWMQVGYLAAAVAGVFSGGGKADDVAKAARELGDTVVDKIGDALKSAKRVTTPGPDPVKRRVKLRKSVRKELEANQPRNAAGEMVDPNTRKPLKPGEIDVGHKPGQEWRKRQQMHRDRGSTRSEVRDAENDPDLYQLEDRSSNRSHRHEQD